MKSKFTRDQEILALHMLSFPLGIDHALVEKRWSDVLVAVEFARSDAPVYLANTDPVLFLQIRNCVTRFLLGGGRVFNTEKLRQLASQSSNPPVHS